MSTIRHYLNNSFPQPILDVDVSSINTSDTNNYLFDYSQITADDTFKIIEATIDSGSTNSSKYIGCVSPGSASDSSNGSSTFKFYKFMAFKEQLTEEQLEEVYERYNFYMGN